MTIEITRPETEAIITSYLQSGEFDSVDQLVSVAMDALRSRQPSVETTMNGRKQQGRQSLIELFADSPFHGLNMEFDESDDAKDLGREVNL